MDAMHVMLSFLRGLILYNSDDGIATSIEFPIADHVRTSLTRIMKKPSKDDRRRAGAGVNCNRRRR